MSMELQESLVTGGGSIGGFRPLGGFVVSLVAGVLILAGGVAMLGYSSGPFGGMMRGYTGVMGGFNGGMMSGYYGMMQGFGGWFYALAIVGVVTGLVVLLEGVIMYDRPGQAATWGTLVLVFSIVSLFGAGGFFVGAILGVVGGILALTWRDSASGLTAAALTASSNRLRII